MQIEPNWVTPFCGPAVGFLTQRRKDAARRTPQPTCYHAEVARVAKKGAVATDGHGGFTEGTEGNEEVAGQDEL